MVVSPYRTPPKRKTLGPWNLLSCYVVMPSKPKPKTLPPWIRVHWCNAARWWSAATGLGSLRWQVLLPQWPSLVPAMPVSLAGSMVGQVERFFTPVSRAETVSWADDGKMSRREQRFCCTCDVNVVICRNATTRGPSRDWFVTLIVHVQILWAMPRPPLSGMGRFGAGDGVEGCWGSLDGDVRCGEATGRIDTILYDSDKEWIASTDCSKWRALP